MLQAALFSTEDHVAIDMSHEQTDSKEVSYLHFLAGCKSLPFFTHAKVGVVDEVYCLEGDPHIPVCSPVELNKFVAKTTKKGGVPFVRYVFEVNPDIIQKLRFDASLQNPALGCSHGVCSVLADTVFKVPFPISMSPLATSLLLAYNHKYGSKKVKRIEFYRSRNNCRNARVILPSVTLEAFFVLWFLYNFTRLAISFV